MYEHYIYIHIYIYIMYIFMYINIYISPASQCNNKFQLLIFGRNCVKTYAFHPRLGHSECVAVPMSLTMPYYYQNYNEYLPIHPAIIDMQSKPEADALNITHQSMTDQYENDPHSSL